MAYLNSNLKRKPSFFWQGLLIVLPVVLLTAVGIFSLRQDRNLARQEAVDRAQVIANDLLPKIWAEITELKDPSQSAHPSFRVDQSGQLIFPPPYTPIPSPRPFDSAALTPGQAQLWLAVQKADSAARSSGIQACSDFLGSNPPENFAAATQFRLGLLLKEQGKIDAAAEAFGVIAIKYPDACGETGLQLQPLAQLKLLELAAGATNRSSINGPLLLDTLCSNAVWHPTLLSPYLLSSEVAGVLGATNRQEKWERIWESHESSRELYMASSQQFHSHNGTALPGSVVPRLFWFSTRDDGSGNGSVSASLSPLGMHERRWLATRFDNGGAGFWVVCRDQSEIGGRIAAMANEAGQLPDYFGVGIEFAGKKLASLVPDIRVWGEENYFGRNGGGVKKTYTDEKASDVLASSVKLDAGEEQLKVSIYLTSPTALFKRQRARTFWFGSLIAAAAVAALIGFLAARRAFNRQLRLSEMKSNFVSSVSHELRAPIASVRLMAEGLERGKIQAPEKQQEYFRFIVQECRRLSSLIENVLDFSRIEQGRKEYEMESTDLVALTRQTVQLMGTYAAEQGIAITFQTSGEAVPVDVDGKAMQQALVNLMDNAIKHSPKGAEIKTGLEFKAGSVALWVEDCGEGIAATEHEKIFERFYRIGSELRRDTQGVGIGLSIVKHIVEAHGGRVTVRSAPGEGSRFTIELPLVKQQDAKDGG
ncbi:MAG: Alkaline phosphatase synthesis sensor protein PhoR [Pedosphaera sp.]|nr:Alkaline phosphatase synthesis sensor protein PhoR [Pedosphaera sp.]